jgi:hypothetical protein
MDFADGTEKEQILKGFSVREASVSSVYTRSVTVTTEAPLFFVRFMASD